MSTSTIIWLIGLIGLIWLIWQIGLIFFPHPTSNMDAEINALRERLQSSPRVPFPDMPPGGVLVGLGADVVDIDRIRAVHERQGGRFLERVYTPCEISYCMGMGDPHQHLAARFAAKEAVAKAFTTGIGAEIGWRSVSVRHGSRQEPLVQLDEKARELLARVSATHVLIALSHTSTVAMAVAVLVRSEEG
ncbi:MAG: holo-ACP synthase [Opitutaceae bacterium]|nr:holo-ACP synthase [Opitutaceae bacterium]